MSNEAFEKFLGSSAGIKATVQLRNCEIAERGFAQIIWQAAIAYMQEQNKSAEQSEPVAEIILDPSFLPALRVPLIDWKTPIVDFEVGTKLYDKPQPLKRLDEITIDEIFSTYTDEQGYVAIDDWHLLTNAIMDEIERINK